MRKVIVSNMVSLDGFYASNSGDIDWFVVDDGFFKYANDLLDQVDTILFGRVTYEGMASYWPTVPDDDVMGVKMNTLPKVVFSKTLDRVGWGMFDNARLVKTDLAEEIKKLKQQPGKDMVIYGSGEIVAALSTAGLIDEYHIIISPVVLGSGKSMFDGLPDRLKLSLFKSVPFDIGSILLYYRPDSQP